jgi:transcriptional regulator with XRE-family HTH domain
MSLAITFIKSILKQDKISITELSRRTGIHRVQLSRILNGHSEPTVANLRSISRALGLAVGIRHRSRKTLVQL